MRIFVCLSIAAMLTVGQSAWSATTATQSGDSAPVDPIATRRSVPEQATPRTPHYPKATTGWNVPLGQRDRTTGTVINRFIIHHTTNTGDESPYFKRRNERSSCPTWYVTSAGEVIEFIHPVKRPSSTGAANNSSVAVETQNTSRAPDWGISEQSHEALAQMAAWLSQQKNFGPYPVDIKLDRTHIIGHNEAGVNATACPGPSMRMDWIVERARQIVAEQSAATPR